MFRICSRCDCDSAIHKVSSMYARTGVDTCVESKDGGEILRVQDTEDW